MAGIKIADTLVPMSDFPSAYAKDIEFSDSETLQYKLDNGEIGGGVEIDDEHSSTDTVYSNAKVDELLEDKADKTDIVEIDDTSTTATDKVWSAKKVNDSLVDIESALGKLEGKIFNNAKVDIVLYDEFDVENDNIQNRLYLRGNILYGSLYLRFDEEHDPFIQQMSQGGWMDIADVPQITSAPQLYNCISYADTEVDNDYAKGDVRIWDGKLSIRTKKQPTVSRNNWYVFYQAVCMKVELAE